MLAVGDAWRRELQRLRIGIRARDGDEAERSPVLRHLFEGGRFPGDRVATRAHFEFADDECVLLQPTRAIARKAVPRALGFGEELARLVPDPVRFWLTGPAEDGYGPELARVTAATALPVAFGRAASAGRYSCFLPFASSRH